MIRSMRVSMSDGKIRGTMQTDGREVHRKGQDEVVEAEGVAEAEDEDEDEAVDPSNLQAHRLLPRPGSAQYLITLLQMRKFMSRMHLYNFHILQIYNFFLYLPTYLFFSTEP
jgi:hypothetical protein